MYSDYFFFLERKFWGWGGLGSSFNKEIYMRGFFCVVVR